MLLWKQAVLRAGCLGEGATSDIRLMSAPGMDGQILPFLEPSTLSLRDLAFPGSAPYLRAGVSGHQALQLQRGSLSDGEHPLGVTLLLQVARLPGVDDADSRGRCRGERERASDSAFTEGIETSCF